MASSNRYFAILFAYLTLRSLPGIGWILIVFGRLMMQIIEVQEVRVVISLNDPEERITDESKWTQHIWTDKRLKPLPYM